MFKITATVISCMSFREIVPSDEQQRRKRMCALSNTANNLLRNELSEWSLFK